MDIAAFISELLEHEDQLSVPGLGTFFRSRMEGYYNKEQQQFYPPSLQLQFNPDLHEDDNKLVNHMVAQNQVNAASARYFLERYVSDILEKVETENVLLGELGTFSMRRGALFFAPKKLNNNNELFYGLAPVKLRRNRMQTMVGNISKPTVQMPYTEKPSAFTQALLRGEPMPGKPLSAVNEKVTEAEEGEEKKPAKISTWVLIAAIVILVSGIGLICAYKYNPALFERYVGSAPPPPVVSDKKQSRRVSDSIQHAIEMQKSIGMTPQVDSTTKSKILAPEAPRDTFGIVIGKFEKREGALKEYDRYKYAYKLDLDIRKSPTDTRNPYQLTAAIYFSVDSAQNHLDEFKRKLGLPTMFIQQYPYKKPQ